MRVEGWEGAYDEELREGGDDDGVDGVGEEGEEDHDPDGELARRLGLGG